MQHNYASSHCRYVDNGRLNFCGIESRKVAFDMAGNVSEAHHVVPVHQGSTQESAFSELYDAKTASMRMGIGSGPGHAALVRLNEATCATFRDLAKAGRYSLNSTLSQGACLVVAMFDVMGLLESAWTGPSSPLSTHAVHVIRQFTGTGTVKVTIPVLLIVSSA